MGDRAGASMGQGVAAAEPGAGAGNGEHSDAEQAEGQMGRLGNGLDLKVVELVVPARAGCPGQGDSKIDVGLIINCRN